MKGKSYTADTLAGISDAVGSADEADQMEVQVSGKSARSARRLTSRNGLAHLRSAPAGALQAAAEQAVADHLEGSSHPRAIEDISFHSTAISTERSTPRYNRSQSHMDLPKQGSAAITPTSAALAMDSMASSSSSGFNVPLVSRTSGCQFTSPFLASNKTLVSPAAAPEVQEGAVQRNSAPLPGQQDISSMGGRQLSRKISGNKLILSTGDNMDCKNGEILLPPQATPFACAGRGGFENLEICFSGKSARMSRGAVRRSDTIAAH